MRFRFPKPIHQPALQRVQELEQQLCEVYRAWPEQAMNHNQIADLRSQLAQAWDQRRQEIACIKAGQPLKPFASTYVPRRPTRTKSRRKAA